MEEEISISYGNQTEVVCTGRLSEIVVARAPEGRPQISDESLRRSVDAPSMGPPLEEFLKGTHRLLVVVNDGTRKTATARVLEAIKPHLDRVDYRILIASGAHRKPTSEDLERILGGVHPELRERTVFHDSREREKMVRLGRSRRGTNLLINSLAIESDRIVVITSVEPHYFAGFMGGRKSFLPGIASCETIVENHKLSLHRMARTFSLRRNPVHNDMMEVFDHLDRRRIFSIQLLQDSLGKVVDSLAGDIHNVFFHLAGEAKKLSGTRIGRKADILLMVVSDPDLTLYDSRKAISYGSMGLRRGGTLILVSPCRKGLGNPDFFGPIIASRSPQHLLGEITRDFQLGHQRLAKWLDALLGREVYLVSALPPQTVEETFLKPYQSVSAACREAIRKRGRSSKLAVVFNGAKLIPLPG